MSTLGSNKGWRAWLALACSRVDFAQDIEGERRDSYKSGIICDLLW